MKIFLVVNPTKVATDKAYRRQETFEEAMAEARRLSLQFPMDEFLVIEVNPDTDATLRAVDGRFSWFAQRRKVQ
jgi:hypothetical protein